MSIKNLKEPFVIILIGPPLSGKTTWIRENFPTTEVISRDEIVMEVYGSRNYTEAFKSVDQKEVDKVLAQKVFYDEEKTEFMQELGLTEPGLNRVIRAGYSLLTLQTYFTAILERLLLSRRHTKPGYLYKYCHTVGEVSPSMVFF